jgi:hypothetical protein
MVWNPPNWEPSRASTIAATSSANRAAPGFRTTMPARTAGISQIAYSSAPEPGSRNSKGLVITP